MYPHTKKHSSDNLFGRLGLGHQPCCRLDPQPANNALTRSLTIKKGWTPERNWLGKPKQNTYNQDQSIFFKLPVEIRQMIYHEALGGNYVALEAGTVKRLTRVGERHNSRFVPCRSKWTTLRDNLEVPSMTKDERNKVEGLLNLVVSCRRIYSESIDILYSANVFRKNFFPLDWTRMILPQRMNAIRTLVVDFNMAQALKLSSSLKGRNFYGDLNAPPKQWRSTWQKIISMESLRSLHVRIRVRSRIDKFTSWFSHEGEVALFKPFLEVHHLDVYEVLCWYPDGYMILGTLNGNNDQYQLIRVKEVFSIRGQLD